MFNQIKDLIRYFFMFQAYLGNRIYIIFFLILIASILEGFGILMLLPLLENLDNSESLESGNELSKMLVVIFNFFGIAGSTFFILLFITIAFILKGFFNFFALGYSAKLKGILLFKLKGRLFNSYSKMNYNYYSSKDTGHFTNLINEQPNKTLDAFHHIINTGGQFFNAIILLGIAFLLTWVFGLLAIFAGFVLIILFFKLNSYVRNLSRITAKENGILTKWLIQTLHGFKYLTSTGQIDILKKNILKSIGILTSNQIKTGTAAAFTQSVREPFAVFFIMSIVIIQLFLFEQKLEPILVSIVLFYRALGAVLAIQSSFQGTFQLIGSLELVDEEFENQKKNKVLDGKLILNKFLSQVELRNVYFNYKNDNLSVIKNISLTIPVNKSIAFVGESGAGKSTLIDMITLLHKPIKGQILIDGIDSLEIEKLSWRKQIGYVSQETVIFDDTLANNVSMWGGDYDNDNELKKKIRSAAKQANILDFIDTLPNGFNSMVGDRGILMSGGQKQRLFIARELFRKPKLIILDEATSSLDSESESQIQKSIESLKGKVTVIIIAHRLSTIKNVDQIYVLNNGQIFEKGTFKELIKVKGSIFKKLSSHQSLQ